MTISTRKTSPVRGSATLRCVGRERWFVARNPADDGIAHVVGVPGRIVRLIAHFDRVGNSGFGESRVPLEQRRANRRLILRRNLVGEIVDDRTALEIPAVDVAHEGRRRRIVGEVLLRGDKVADPVVGESRNVRALRRRRNDRVVHLQAQTARIALEVARLRSDESEARQEFVVFGQRFRHLHVRARRIDRESRARRQRERQDRRRRNRRASGRRSRSRVRKNPAETTTRFVASSSATIGVLLITESAAEIASESAAAVFGAGCAKYVFFEIQSTRRPTRLNSRMNGVEKRDPPRPRRRRPRRAPVRRCTRDRAGRGQSRGRFRRPF